MDTVADQLNLAADYMQEHGWTRGRYARDDRVCLLGALTIGVKRTHPGTSTDDAQNRLRQYIRATYHLSIVGFNDGTCKSKQEAVRTLRDAAAWTGGQPA